MTARLAALPVVVALAGVAGGCGSSGDNKDDTAVRDAVRGYFQAVRARDGVTACAALTDSSRERIGEFAGKLGQPDGSGCPGTMRAFFASGAMAQLQAAGHADIASVRRKGDRATVRVDGVGAPLTLQRAQGAWRIAFAPSVEADKLP